MGRKTIEQQLGEKVMDACENREREIIVNQAYYKYQMYLSALGKKRNVEIACNVNEAYTDYKIWLYLNKKGLD
jgi:hypothetical protein